MRGAYVPRPVSFWPVLAPPLPGAPLPVVPPLGGLHAGRRATYGWCAAPPPSRGATGMARPPSSTVDGGRATFRDPYAGAGASPVRDPYAGAVPLPPREP